jgi:hypothetical protein
LSLGAGVALKKVAALPGVLAEVVVSRPLLMA